MNPSRLSHGIIVRYECGFTRLEISYIEAKVNTYKLMAFQESNDSFRTDAANKVYDYYEYWKTKNKGFKQMWEQFLSVSGSDFLKFCTLLVLVRKE